MTLKLRPVTVLHLYICGMMLVCTIPSLTSAEANKPAVSDGNDSGFVTEKRSDGTTVKYKKKTSYDFEGSNIDGMYNKPSGSYISNIKDVKAKNIIRIRENFDAEVVDSSRLIK